ncbi:MAG: hypothetical protein ABJQ29_08410 [Luteolibacter sp.]
MDFFQILSNVPAPIYSFLMGSGSSWLVRGFVEDKKTTNKFLHDSLSDFKNACGDLTDEIYKHLNLDYSGTANDHLKIIQTLKDKAYGKLCEAESVVSECQNLRGLYYEYLQKITDGLPTSKSRNVDARGLKDLTKFRTEFMSAIQKTLLRSAKGKIRPK